jgi:hypothetical protein
VEINGQKDGKKTQFIMSSGGIKGYSENSNGKMEHTLDFDFGRNGRPSGLWNMSYEENTGFSIGAVTGVVGIGTTEASTQIYGGSIGINSVFLGKVIDVGLDTFKILGKDVSWQDNGDGTFTLIGR